MTADPIGGVWTYAMELCRGLTRGGDEVVLATMGAPLTSSQRAEVRARGLTLHESTFRLEWMQDPWPDLDAAGAWLLDLERRARPDLVHLNGYVHAAVPWSAPVVVVGHSCVLSWWRAVHGQDAPPEYDRYRSAVAAGIHAADQLMAPTQAMLDMLVAIHGRPRSARVIPNGRDAIGRRRREAVPREPIVLAAGRVWDDAKDMTTLDAAAPSIQWPVHVAGANRDPSGRRRHLPNVRPLGMLPPGTLQQWYHRASIFVQPSLYEPFGLAALEAALAGCALVLADIRSAREVWGDAAVYVPPREPAALAAAVNALAERPRTLAQRAAAAQRRADELTARRMVQAYRSAYRELCLRRPGSRQQVSA